jgi:hypothetical protein
LTGQSGDPGCDRSGAGRTAAGAAGSIADGIAGIQGNVQRWLLRSGAENMRREVGDQFRKAFGGGQDDKGDPWGKATTETPPDGSTEAPECAWCPVCRTARRMRESGTPKNGLAGAGDAVAAAVQEALSAFDAFLSMRPPAPRTSGRPDHDPDGRG